MLLIEAKVTVVFYEMGDDMKVALLVIGFMFFTVAFSGMLAIDNPPFAQYPPPPTGCCKQRAWLAADWNETELRFSQCAELNKNRDNLDDILAETGYVWWDVNCK